MNPTFLIEDGKNDNEEKEVRLEEGESRVLEVTYSEEKKGE